MEPIPFYLEQYNKLYAERFNAQNSDFNKNIDVDFDSENERILLSLLEKLPPRHLTELIEDIVTNKKNAQKLFLLSGVSAYTGGGDLLLNLRKKLLQSTESLSIIPIILQKIYSLAIENEYGESSEQVINFVHGFTFEHGSGILPSQIENIICNEKYTNQIIKLQLLLILNKMEYNDSYNSRANFDIILLNKIWVNIVENIDDIDDETLTILTLSQYFPILETKYLLKLPTVFLPAFLARKTNIDRLNLKEIFTKEFFQSIDEAKLSDDFFMYFLETFEKLIIQLPKLNLELDEVYAIKKSLESYMQTEDNFMYLIADYILQKLSLLLPKGSNSKVGLQKQHSNVSMENLFSGNISFRKNLLKQKN